VAIDLPTRARVVIVGGGVIGCSVAYHLTKMGWSDVVLLERKQLTSGTTWHAAGLVGQLRQSINMTQLARYTAELYRGLEAETGQATGYRQCGSLSLATTPGRMEELKRNASMAKVFGLAVNVVGPQEIHSLYPLANLEDVIGGIHIPSDGYANAVDITQALAKGARKRGAQIFQDLKVTAIHHDGERVSGVQTDRGRIDADYVVLCGGMWTRDLAAGIGVTVPLHACEHYYVLFQDVPGLRADMPVLRDYDHCSYFKYDAGKLLVGAFEPHARPWGADGIPDDFSFGEIAGDFSHFEPVLLDAMRRIPALERVGRASELLRRGGTQFHRPAIGRRHRQSRVRMDARRPPAGRSVGGGRAAQYAVPDQPQISARASGGKLGALVRNALAVPSIRNGARRA
jgi:glycine/D-amino acid oxidase-like deaminating enzyme